MRETSFSARGPLKHLPTSPAYGECQHRFTFTKARHTQQCCSQRCLTSRNDECCPALAERQHLRRQWGRKSWCLSWKKRQWYSETRGKHYSIWFIVWLVCVCLGMCLSAEGLTLFCGWLADIFWDQHTMSPY